MEPLNIETETSSSDNKEDEDRIALKVKQISIRNAHWNYGSVFLTFNVKDEIYKTTECKKAHQGTATFPSIRIDIKSELTKRDVLEVKLFQKNLFNERLIGKINVELCDLLHSTFIDCHNVSFYNENKKRLKVTADLSLEFLEELAPPLQRKHTRSSRSLFGFGDLNEDGSMKTNGDEDGMEKALKDIAASKISLPVPEIVAVDKWKVNISINKGKDLSASELKFVCKVKLNGDERTTKAGETAEPEWNEQFTIVQKHSKQVFLDSKFNVEVYHPKTLGKEKVGKACFDLWSLFEREGHQINDKWVVLQCYKTSAIKGFVQVSISLSHCSEDDDETDTLLPAKVKDGHTDDLFLPYGFTAPRDLFTYHVKVYQVDAVCAAKKNGLSFHTVNLADPFVEVEFAGKTRKTSVAKKGVDAVFNEILVFQEFFPPMFKHLKIKLMDHESTNSCEVLASHFVDLSHISFYNQGGALDDLDCEFEHTFGPTWLTLYGSHTDFENSKIQNHAHTPGTFFRGRVLVEISCSKSDKSVPPEKPVKMDNVSSLESVSSKEEYLLFATVYDASMLELKHEHKKVWFEVTIGSVGVHSPNQAASHLKKPTGRTHKKGSEILGIDPVQEDEPYIAAKEAMLSKSQKTCHVPYDQCKPCVHLQFSKDNDSHRVHLTVLLKRMHCLLEDTLLFVEIKIKHDRKTKLKQKLIGKFKKEFEHHADIFFDYYKDLNDLNDLDLKLQDKREGRISQAKAKLQSITGTKSLDEIKMSLRHVKFIITTLLNDPQNTFPDVIVWMVAKEKRIASARIEAEDIFFSKDELMCAPQSGHVQSIFLKHHRGASGGRNSRYIQAKLDIRLWLGASKDFDSFLCNTPEGYITEMPTDTSAYPKALIYNEFTRFALRAHMLQGRTMLGSDRNALSDPFARVMCASEMEETCIIPETRNPLWNQTFTFEEIVIYGTENMHIPVVLISVFDKDPNDEEEFIGQTVAKPKIMEDDYQPADLHWRPLLLGKEPVGHILASFELFPVDKVPLPELPAQKKRPGLFTKKDQFYTPIPPEIALPLKKYRLELLFWGVRDLKKHAGVLGRSVDKPFIVADMSYECTFLDGRPPAYNLKSTVCKNPLRNLNFDQPVVICDVELPENEEFMSELTFRVYDKRRFSNKEEFFATHTTTPLNKFLCHSKSYSTYFPNADKQENNVVYTPRKANNFQQQQSKETSLWMEDDFEEQITWWSRYYITLNDIENPTRIQTVQEENIPRIKIYENELEKNFDNFNDILTSFKLVRGKQDRYRDEYDAKRVKGQIKGAIRLWKLDEIENKELLSHKNGTFQDLPSMLPVKVCVRVYCIAAFNLTAMDSQSKKSDPFIYVEFGKSRAGGKEHRINKSLNPEFGQVYDVEGTLPLDTTLKVSVYDYDRGITDELIGETTIDIENRYFTKYRARCGISQVYHTEGCTAWRDNESPREILYSLCSKYNYQYDIEKDEDIDEQSLRILKRFQKFTHPLVPEHVETRTLTHPNEPALSQGSLRMWVDIFPHGSQPKTPVDITKTPAKEFELRVIVWNCENVELIDKSILLGAKSSDIYFTGWLRGMGETMQKSDVHYRSLDGSGKFNWRFVYRFHYDQAKKMFAFKKKGLLDIDATEIFKPPDLLMECREADIIGSTLFGTLEVNLLNVPPFYAKASGWKLNDWNERKQKTASKDMISLFRHRTFKGWFPFIGRAENSEELKIRGRAEIEFELVSADEAELRPVGKRREDPNGLPKPDRPEESMGLFLSPLKMLRLLWRMYKKYIFLLVVLILILLIVVLFIYALPGYLAKKTLGE